MKVLLLSDTNSEHTEKWALGLADNDIKVGLFSFNKASYDWYNHPNITVFFEPDKKINAESTFTKLSYLKYVTILKKIIKHFDPDILHAHYATSYGLIGALSGFKPYILSVWGADVYDFPSRSKFHKRIFQFNLKKADVLMSTSHVMKDELARYTGKNVVVTPFGVDTEVFRKKDNIGREKNVVSIGTIKPIEEKYGIVYIIEAAEILVNKFGKDKFRFYLIGDGHDLDYWRKVVHDKNLNDCFDIPGRIPFNEISNYHNMLDIFLNVSVEDSESFGVATVESMSCEKPVIVTDVGGLKEVVNNGEFGIIVPKRDSLAIASSIEDLMIHPEKAADLGKRARKNVLSNYDWQNNLRQMISEYKKLIK
jgi:glycosyltransferase involved in cell wall biosynthesis